MFSRRMQCLLISASAMLPGGCVVPLAESETSERHLLLGVGLVSISRLPNSAATASDVVSLGLALSDAPGWKATAGYAQSQVVQVAQGVDIGLELSREVHGVTTIVVTDYAEEEETHEDHPDRNDPVRDCPGLPDD